MKFNQMKAKELSYKSSNIMPNIENKLLNLNKANYNNELNDKSSFQQIESKFKKIITYKRENFDFFLKKYIIHHFWL